MFKRVIDDEAGRAVAALGFSEGLAKATKALARARGTSQKAQRAADRISALEAKVERCTWWLEQTSGPKPLPDALLYVGSYLYLCGKHQWPPSIAHMKAVGRPLPRKSKALEKCLADALALQWATLDELGRFLWTAEGEEELTAIDALWQGRK